MTRFQLSLQAENLPKSLFHTPSPYAHVAVAGGPAYVTEVGKTETIVKNTSPDWVMTMFIETDASINLPLTVSVWDDRGPNKDDILIGEVVFEATVIYQSPGRVQSQKLKGGGT
jgi:Ca2+-dependent lipid-binding protein